MPSDFCNTGVCGPIVLILLFSINLSVFDLQSWNWL